MSRLMAIMFFIASTMFGVFPVWTQISGVVFHLGDDLCGKKQENL